MISFLELVSGQPVRTFAAGEIALQQDEPCHQVLVLLEGEVEVLRDEQRVARASEPGAVFGEMAMLLGGICTASVRCQTPARFAVIDQPMDFFAASPAASLHIARLLARRIDALNRYLVDVKRQYEGHDHLGMVDTVLGVLVHRQVAPQVERPPLSPKN
jgi:CRP/FNR family transcriptional regulator, cyclic AMP receptor protein